MKVRAKAGIVEYGFNDVDVWTHAEAGDLGDVVGLNEGLHTVTWRNTGTTCDCHLDELEIVS